MGATDPGRARTNARKPSGRSTRTTPQAIAHPRKVRVSQRMGGVVLSDPANLLLEVALAEVTPLRQLPHAQHPDRVKRRSAEVPSFVRRQNERGRRLTGPHCASPGMSGATGASADVLLPRFHFRAFKRWRRRVSVELSYPPLL